MPAITTIKEPAWVDLGLAESPFGNLYHGQANGQFPFPVNRVYFVCGIPAGAARGGHAHLKNEEIVFCISGACSLWLYDANQRQCIFRLDAPSRGVYVPTGWWVELGDYSDGAMTLVVASLPFMESDYIRDPKAFFRETPYPDSVYRSRP